MNPTAKQALALDNLFAPLQSGQDCREVTFSGERGSGKSVLMAMAFDRAIDERMQPFIVVNRWRDYELSIRPFLREYKADEARRIHTWEKLGKLQACLLSHDRAVVIMETNERPFSGTVYDFRARSVQRILIVHDLQTSPLTIFAGTADNEYVDKNYREQAIEHMRIRHDQIQENQQGPTRFLDSKSRHL